MWPDRLRVESEQRLRISKYSIRHLRLIRFQCQFEECLMESSSVHPPQRLTPLMAPLSQHWKRPRLQDLQVPDSNQMSTLSPLKSLGNSTVVTTMPSSSNSIANLPRFFSCTYGYNVADSFMTGNHGARNVKERYRVRQEQALTRGFRNLQSAHQHHCGKPR